MEGSETLEELGYSVFEGWVVKIGRGWSAVFGGGGGGFFFRIDWVKGWGGDLDYRNYIEMLEEGLAVFDSARRCMMETSYPNWYHSLLVFITITSHILHHPSYNDYYIIHQT